MSSKSKSEAKVETVEVEDDMPEALIEDKADAPVEETELEIKSNLAYLGPTITGVIKHSTVFQDGILPERIQKCVAEFPMMERLFVKIDEMPEAVKDLHKEQSALSTIFKQTANRFQTRR